MSYLAWVAKPLVLQCFGHKTLGSASMTERGLEALLRGILLNHRAQAPSCHKLNSTEGKGAPLPSDSPLPWSGLAEVGPARCQEAARSDQRVSGVFPGALTAAKFTFQGVLEGRPCLFLGTCAV